MLIGGLQKTSLLDYPDKISTVIFTCGCNFRCNYCHNPHLIENPEEIMSGQELIEMLEKRKNYIEAVVITGGEPTIQKDLKDFIKKLKVMGFLVKLDTNGANPEITEELINNKLIDYIAMDIKAPLGLYKEITNSDIDEQKIKQSINLIMNSGIDYEFRTTVYPKLTTEHFKQILDMIRGAKRFFIQQYKPGTTLKKEQLKPYDTDKLKELLNLAKDFVEHTALRGVD